MNVVRVAFALAVALPLGAQSTYQIPPAPIEQLLDAPPAPRVVVSPNRQTLLIEQPASFPTIAEVAQPRLRLAGLRFNPATATSTPANEFVNLRLQRLGAFDPVAIAGLPAAMHVVGAIWSPDSAHVAFYQRVDKPTPAIVKTGRNATSSIPDPAGLQLWMIDVVTAHAQRLGLIHLSEVLGAPCTWMPDSKGVLCKLVPIGRGPAPKLNEVPLGPNISENLGKATPAPTYEDMLQTPEDERLFEYHATSQLAVVAVTGPMHMTTVTGLIASADPSPDGRFLLVETLHRPFSYTVPADAFPMATSVVTLATGATKTLFDRPVVDNLPISRDAVAAGPRDYQWRSDAPATVVFVEAANKGLPDVKAPVADYVKQLAAPFDGTAATMLESPLRVLSLAWYSDHLAVANTGRFADRKTAMLSFDPSTAGKVTTLYAGSSQDRYHSPGRPVLEPNGTGHMVLRLNPDRSGIFFISQGASPAGDQPFVAVLPLNGGPEKLLFRSSDPYYSEPVAIVSDVKALVRRESQTESPNYYLASLTGTNSPTELTKVTNFASPYKDIKLPKQQLLHYKRADGVDLTATLWTPAGYDRSQGPLPTLMVAYPAEFKTRAAASQVAGSADRFPTFGWGGSAVYFAQVGYAVLENASIPIIGEGDQQPNDTYVQQLVDAAKAAVDYGVSLGVVDRKRVAVMGHSYGAFMTANLLAHTDIFRAGIARSGAYNRTLTPYGFQNEERTYWQDPKVYYDMSPFSFADKIKAPLLLIHGEADDNTGTYPIQSERFYAALKGQGATVRMVMLPLEAHHYAAHESVQHMLWEMDRWLEMYVKPAK